MGGFHQDFIKETAGNYIGLKLAIRDRITDSITVEPRTFLDDLFGRAFIQDAEF
tara:strand:- start:268 stop:429 length:162 start_codon:yes stop_codon:yes gene_type:complete